MGLYYSTGKKSTLKEFPEGLDETSLLRPLALVGLPQEEETDPSQRPDQ